jgi:single-stranded-DNA-specific exonuclease
VHGWELDLRAPLAELYRALRAAGGADGPALEALLRGTAAPARTGALAGRLLRVLAELGLVAVEHAPLRVAVGGAPARTRLERSPAFRAYQLRLADGLAGLPEPGAPRRASEPTRTAA